MHEEVKQAIKRIHDSKTKIVYFFAGVGAEALAWLHRVPGSSRTVKFAADLYSPESMEKFLRHIPDQFVSERTAILMASAAYNVFDRDDDRQVNDEWEDIIGVSMTGAVATDRTRKGEDRAHIAIYTEDRWYEITSHVASINFEKGKMTREIEEINASSLLILMIDAYITKDWKNVKKYMTNVPPDYALMVTGFDGPYAKLPDGRISDINEIRKDYRIIVPGSFDPLHEGHIMIAEVAMKHLGEKYVAFELSAKNADKGYLPVKEIERRTAQFDWKYPIIVSENRLFENKAYMFRGTKDNPRYFAIGIDTAERILDSKYYGGTQEGVDNTLKMISNENCRLLVMGRKVGTEFKTLRDLNIPDAYKHLFIELPGRCDISSTELRESAHERMVLQDSQVRKG